MGKRSKNASRCARCRLHTDSCLCGTLPRLQVPTRLCLIMHHREVDKPTATGPLAMACLPNSELHVHGLRDAPLSLEHLHDPARRALVLFPAEGARTLDSALLAEDPRPVTLVVPDGSWRQARRMPQRLAALSRLPRVVLPAGPPSRWGVRWEPMAEGLATMEAIARAFGALESQAVQTVLEDVFQRMVEATLAARGRERIQPHSPPRPQAHSEALPILYQDDFLVAINKPSGLPAHRGWARDGVPALQRLRDQLGRYVYPVHRLDRATSGVLLFALTSEVARDLQVQFSDGQVRKRYLALCRGHDPALRRVDHPLATHPDGPKRPAVTDFELLGAFERYGLYAARPHQGRTHQIRRHLKHASHPIIGDVRYGKGEHNRLFRERYGFQRLALHCERLCLAHPRLGTALDLTAPLGQDLAALLARLGLPS